MLTAVSMPHESLQNSNFDLFMNNSRIPQAIMVECEDAVWLGMATVVRFLFFTCFCHSDDFI
uniref:Uncharacterized protein n=1 Tax=Heterorhabditis bacteriophora TaxID=37862 RepID=A0A1I7X7K5_HETBA